MLKHRKIFIFLLSAIILPKCLCLEWKTLCTDKILFVMPADNGTILKVEATERNIKLLKCVIDRSFFLCPRLNKETDFLLYTKKNPKVPQRLAPKNVAIEKSHFDKHKLTVVLFHGWLSTPSTSLIVKIKNALLENHDCNVISVDWSRNSKSIIYHLSNMYMHHTGRECINFVRFLINYGVTVKHMHFIGYGFGAHMAAHVANSISKTTLIGRFTGLEVSEPLMCMETYNALPIRSYMDEMKNVSCFVNAIHTSPFGKRSPVGHADFYPDGGINQNPCEGKDTKDFSCSHIIVIEYFVHSILNNHTYTGKKCKSFEDLINDSCNDSTSETSQEVNMGFNVPSTTRGVFYVSTHQTVHSLDKTKVVSSKAIKNLSLNTQFMINTFLMIWCGCFVTCII